MYDQWLPLGVVGVISAYNFPAAVWAQNGFLAAIGGNTVIWKPSPKVPLTAIGIQHLCNQAMKELGQQGVFSLFIPQDNAVAERLVADRRVAMVSFTGSTAVGRKVAQIVGATLGRRYMLECSGNNGCIIDETADLKLAARSITFGAVGTTGQRCTSTRRVIAHRSVEKELVGLLKRAFEQIKVGDPRQPDTVVGPLVDRAAVGHFEAAVRDAVALGGVIACGGKRIDRPGYYVEATLITERQAGLAVRAARDLRADRLGDAVRHARRSDPDPQRSAAGPRVRNPQHQPGEHRAVPFGRGHRLRHRQGQHGNHRRRHRRRVRRREGNRRRAHGRLGCLERLHAAAKRVRELGRRIALGPAHQALAAIFRST
jgi:hypothetical protein